MCDKTVAHANAARAPTFPAIVFDEKLSLNFQQHDCYFPYAHQAVERRRNFQAKFSTRLNRPPSSLLHRSGAFSSWFMATATAKIADHRVAVTNELRTRASRQLHRSAPRGQPPRASYS
jgi:hypothetical protein